MYLSLECYFIFKLICIYSALFGFLFVVVVVVVLFSICYWNPIVLRSSSSDWLHNVVLFIIIILSFIFNCMMSGLVFRYVSVFVLFVDNLRFFWASGRENIGKARSECHCHCRTLYWIGSNAPPFFISPLFHREIKYVFFFHLKYSHFYSFFEHLL